MKRAKNIFRNCVFLFLMMSAESVFVSCQKGGGEGEDVSSKMHDFAFEMARYSITQKCDIPNANRYYYPQQMKVLVSRYYWNDSMRYYSVEQYYEDKTGVIESSLFYNPMDDDAEWVEDLVIKTEEERIVDEINQMEEDFQKAEYIPDEYEEKINDALDDGKESLFYTDKNNELKIMEFDQEIFIPQRKGDEFIIIETDGKNVERNYYDSKYRISKKEIWDFSNTDSVVLVKQEDFTFVEEQYKPVSKTIRTDDEYTEIKYNAEGLAENSKSYKTVERKPKSKKETETIKEDVITSVYEWTYNEDNLIDTQICTLYYYDSEYKKIDYTFEKKYIYMYNDFETSDDEDSSDIPPDYEYYENGEIKMKTKYSAELGTYTSQVFFDNEMSIKTYYEKYNKVKEVYTEGNTVIRVKEYE